MWIVDLRWLLLFSVVLPLASIAATAGVFYWLDRRNRARATVSALQPILDSAPIGIITLVDGHASPYVNLYARRLLGVDDQALTFETLASIAEQAASVLDQPSAPGVLRTIELDDDLLPAGSKLRLRWWTARWETAQLFFFADKRDQQQAQQRFNLLLGRLSHELRTPLDTILVHLEVIKFSGTSNEQREESVTFAKQEARRLMRLANNALELVRLEGRPFMEMQPFDFAALASEVVEQLSEKAREKTISLRLEADTSLPFAVGSVEQIKQVLINLIRNSIIHGRDGDVVTVTATLGKDGLICTVEDTGPGIESRHLARLTEPFYRAISAGVQGTGLAGVQGTGLGLAIVSEILQQHQSRLVIQSVSEQEAEPGKSTGTCARFILPTAAEAE